MKEIVAKHNLMLILLSNVNGDESEEEIYDRTRFAWKTNFDRASKVDYVISHNSNEEILAIYKPNKWLRGDDEEFKSLERGSLPDRVGFVGEIASEEIQEIYKGCSTPARKRGAANPIRYLNSEIAEDNLDKEDLIEDPFLNVDNEDENTTNESNTKKHTYLAGANTDDDSFDNMVEVAFQFVETAYYKFSEKHPVYLIISKKEEEDINFLDDVSALRLVKLFEGSYDQDDEAPTKEAIRKILEDNSDSRIFDGGYWNLWFLFEFPEEDEEEWEDPGDHWEYTFLQLVKDFDSFIMIGYHSGLEDIIWQQWCGTDYDEGAISNDNSDYYMGDNLQSNHRVDLKCLDIKNFEITN